MTARQRLLQSLAETARVRANDHPDFTAAVLLGSPSVSGGPFLPVPGLFDHLSPEQAATHVTTCHYTDDLCFVFVGPPDARKDYLRLALRACRADAAPGCHPAAYFDQTQAAASLVISIIDDTSKSWVAGLDNALHVVKIDHPHWLPASPLHLPIIQGLPVIVSLAEQSLGSDLGCSFAVIINENIFEAIETRLFMMMAEDEAEVPAADRHFRPTADDPTIAPGHLPRSSQTVADLIDRAPLKASKLRSFLCVMGDHQSVLHQTIFDEVWGDKEGKYTEKGTLRTILHRANAHAMACDSPIRFRNGSGIVRRMDL